MTDLKITPNFRAALNEINKENILIPLLRATMIDPSFAGFELEVEPWTARRYDAWFHPSGQASWTARQLYYYLTAPKLFAVERMSLTSVLAITAGKFWHTFLQRLFLENGILARAEVPLVNFELNMRGHMDGLLTTNEGLEIKTMNQFQLGKFKSAEDLLERHPDYYAQTQDYLAMGGLSSMRYLIVGTGYPFDMTEFSVPFDDGFQKAQARKYRQALQAAQFVRTGLDTFEMPEPTRDAPPAACCAIQSKEAKVCVARAACPIGAAS